MRSSPYALNLLSLLSMLPDGLSDVELIQSQLPLKNLLACKSMLIRTSLAYMDSQKRLKILVPIHEYVRIHHPPANNLINPLGNHYQQLLELWRKYNGTLSNAKVVARVASNFANIQNVLWQRLSSERPHLAELIISTCELSSYSRSTGRGHLPLLDQISDFLPQVTEQHKLEAFFIIQLLDGWDNHSIQNANQLVEQALEHFKHFHDPDMQCELISDLSI
jgi:hypothetical protein